MNDYNKQYNRDMLENCILISVFIIIPILCIVITNVVFETLFVYYTIVFSLLLIWGLASL